MVTDEQILRAQPREAVPMGRTLDNGLEPSRVRDLLDLKRLRERELCEALSLERSRDQRHISFGWTRREDKPGLFVLLFRRLQSVISGRKTHQDRHTASSLGRPVLLPSDLDRVVRSFRDATADLPGLTEITAVLRGNRVFFRVAVDGTNWDEAMDWLTARLQPLVITSGDKFDFRVVETKWHDPDPPRQLVVESLQESAGAR